MPTGMRGSASEGSRYSKRGQVRGIFKRKIPKLLKRERVIESWID